MQLCEKLQALRKAKGLSQEELAEKIGTARQTVGKWETGQAVPELSALIKLSGFYGVSIDSMVKDNGCCESGVVRIESDRAMLSRFLVKAKINTYAGHAPEVEPSRYSSHDLAFRDGDYFYYDTYIGGELFAGEEAVWIGDRPVWSMNYCGRVIGEEFSGDFLKEALHLVSEHKPFRGPDIYSSGDYTYHCRTIGDISWFQGCEEIFCRGVKIYEGVFHGGDIR